MKAKKVICLFTALVFTTQSLFAAPCSEPGINNLDGSFCQQQEVSTAEKPVLTAVAKTDVLAEKAESVIPPPAASEENKANGQEQSGQKAEEGMSWPVKILISILLMAVLGGAGGGGGAAAAKPAPSFLPAGAPPVGIP